MPPPSGGRFAPVSASASTCGAGRWHSRLPRTRALAAAIRRLQNESHLNSLAPPSHHQSMPLPLLILGAGLGALNALEGIGTAYPCRARTAARCLCQQPSWARSRPTRHSRGPRLPSMPSSTVSTRISCGDTTSVRSSPAAEETSSSLHTPTCPRTARAATKLTRRTTVTPASTRLWTQSRSWSSVDA